jgi:hypothetical protein
MIHKRVLRPTRVRVVPRSFSWIDHRLIRDGHLDRLQIPEQLLYFFLILVGDSNGVSYYSLPVISRFLKLKHEAIEEARRSLCERSLIAHEEPLYQVLALPEAQTKEAGRSAAARGGEPSGIAETLRDSLKDLRG